MPRDWPPGPVWVVLPTYNERENLEPMVAAVRAALDASRPTTRCWSSTTPRPTAPASSPTSWPRATRACGCCTGPRKQGLGQAYIAGFRVRAARARRW